MPSTMTWTPEINEKIVSMIFAKLESKPAENIINTFKTKLSRMPMVKHPME